MPLQKIGVNLTGLDNIDTPTFDIANNSVDLLNSIPVKANEITGGWWGLTSLVGLFVFLLWKFNQEFGQGGDFGYDTARSIGVASCVCSIIGLVALNIGFFTNFYHVVIFIVIAFISVGAVWKMQN